VCPPPWVPEAPQNEAIAKRFHFGRQCHRIDEYFFVMQRLGAALGAATAVGTPPLLAF